ncbi:hypothetical protein, partial [Escherichia coli]|uniref:hypothetical protein n=1 Tax=Escherichia coli TaxID=562 RepID=UPI001BC8BC77
QYTLNVTRDMTKSLKDLESEIVRLQDLADSTRETEHFKILKRKKSALSNLLGFSAQGALVRSRYQDIAKMDAPSHFFFSDLNEKMDNKDSCTLRGPTPGSCCKIL